MYGKDQYKKKTQRYRDHPQWSSMLSYPFEQSFISAKVIACKLTLNGPSFIDAVERLLQVGLCGSHRQEREEREDTDYESFQVRGFTTTAFNITRICDGNAVIAWIGAIA